MIIFEFFISQQHTISTAMKLILRPMLTFTKYKVPYNINVEEQTNYLKKVAVSQKLIDDNTKISLIPRRHRRIYDRPRIDKNIEGYGAWRVFDPQQIMHKHNQHAMKVELKLSLAPKWVVHAFGMGALSQENPRSSHRQYHFVDNRLNCYTLFEYRNTTHFRPNIEWYDYENQDNVRPRQRKTKRITPEQFWNSEQNYQFRVNASIYAEKYKFQEWLIQEIEKSKTKKSYDQYIDEKYGKICTFNKKQDCERFQPYKPMVLNVTPQNFALPSTGKKGKAQKQVQAPKIRVGSQMDEKFRIKQRITAQQTSQNSSQKASK